jgi:hypothetical protein
MPSSHIGSRRRCRFGTRMIGVAERIAETALHRPSNGTPIPKFLRLQGVAPAGVASCGTSTGESCRLTTQAPDLGAYHQPISKLTRLRATGPTAGADHQPPQRARPRVVPAATDLLRVVGPRRSDRSYQVLCFLFLVEERKSARARSVVTIGEIVERQRDRGDCDETGIAS